MDSKQLSSDEIFVTPDLHNAIHHAMIPDSRKGGTM